MPQQKRTVEEAETRLEIEEHLHFHEQGWKAQKIGWFFLFAFLAFAAFGAFGDGPASTAALSSNVAHIEYERFYRYQAHMALKVKVDNKSKNQVQVSFPNQYMEHIRIESILPEPREVKVAGGRIHYFFNGQGMINIMFYMVPEKTGSISGIVHVNDEQFSVSHFIYP